MQAVLLLYHFNRFLSECALSVLNWAPHYSHQVHLTLPTDKKVVQTCHDYRKNMDCISQLPFFQLLNHPFSQNGCPCIKSMHVFSHLSQKELICLLSSREIPCPWHFFLIINTYIHKIRYDIHTPHILELYCDFCHWSSTYKVIAHKKYWHMYVIFWQRKNVWKVHNKSTMGRSVRPLS